MLDSKESLFEKALSRISHQACTRMGINIQNTVIHALLPLSAAKNLVREEQGDKSQSVLLFVDGAPAPGILALSSNERMVLMQKIFSVRTFYIEERDPAMNGAANVVPLQVSGSGALANSLCELEMIKRNRRWYMEVRTDVALSNIETHLDFGLGLDAAENFHNFVAEAQNFHKEYRPLLRGNRSILNLGIKGLSSPPVGGISSKSNSDNSSSDQIPF